MMDSNIFKLKSRLLLDAIFAFIIPYSAKMKSHRSDVGFYFCAVFSFKFIASELKLSFNTGVR